MLVTFSQLHLFVFCYPQTSHLVFYLNLQFFFVNSFFLLASFLNPGTVKKNQELQFCKLVEKQDPQGLCPTCSTIYTRDSRHCYICNQCIHNFDHHCQWINNCVGRGNHKMFYLYVLTLLIYLFFVDAVCFIYLDTELTEEDTSAPYNIAGITPFGLDQGI